MARKPAGNPNRTEMKFISSIFIVIALASQATAQDAEALRFARIISDHMVK